MTGIPLRPDQSFRFAIFTGETESDPHKVGFWSVVVSNAGLWMVEGEVPDQDRNEQTVSWHELHRVLVERMALIDEIHALEYEREESEHELIRLRTEARRLKTIVTARRTAIYGDAASGPTLIR